jgi:intracellular multiplication protein IcmT
MDQFTHWRDSARTPKIGMFDYRVVVPYIFLVLSPSAIVFYLFILVILMTTFFGIIQYFGFTMKVFLRWMRSSFISGRYKKTRPWWQG